MSNARNDYLYVMASQMTQTQMLDEITALRAALDQEREKVRELAASPPLASISLCCKIVRIGRRDEATMHDGGCYERNGRKLGPTYYLHDVSALLSGRGETDPVRDPVAERAAALDRQWQKQIDIRRGGNDE